MCEENKNYIKDVYYFNDRLANRSYSIYFAIPPDFEQKFLKVLHELIEEYARIARKDDQEKGLDCYRLVKRIGNYGEDIHYNTMITFEEFIYFTKFLQDITTKTSARVTYAYCSAEISVKKT